jgi:hypothetical protein
VSENPLSCAFVSEGGFQGKNTSGAHGHFHDPYDSREREVDDWCTKTRFDTVAKFALIENTIAKPTTEHLVKDPVVPDLARFRALRDEKPDSKMALIRRAWPDIVAALNSGHTLKHVCKRLNEDGVAVDYKTLSAYVSILRRKQRQAAVA